MWKHVRKYLALLNAGVTDMSRSTQTSYWVFDCDQLVKLCTWQNQSLCCALLPRLWLLRKARAIY
jgi:hypothetical protein